ncbi:MAG: Ada metal-binding domain-containing protein [Planctomycetota bacterium]|jgi:hypothetical protein
MKTKKYYMVLAVVTGILCIWVPAKRGPSALGQIELPLQHDEPFLIGRANPELAGIDKLQIAILPSGDEPNKNGLVWAELEAKVINKFNEADIKLTPAITDSILNIPELRVGIDMLKLEDSRQYVFRIQTLLSRAVYLTKKYEITSSSEPDFGELNRAELILKPDVWKKDSPMQAVSVENMPAVVTGVVLRQVEYFIEAYLAANTTLRNSSLRSTSQPADVKTGETASQITPEEPSKPPGKQVVAEYTYVASKNSEVFHKPQCRWAKKISPRNLGGYNSTDEAVKAGKRPCKLCKP